MSKIEKHNKACQSASKKLHEAHLDDPNAIFTQKDVELISKEAKDMDPVILRRSLATKLIEIGDYEKARSFMLLEDKDLRTDCFIKLINQGNMDLAFSFLTKEEMEYLKKDLIEKPHPPDEEPPAAPAAQISLTNELPKYENS